MYKSSYNTWTGTLRVYGDSYDIDQALDLGRINEARKLYRAGTIASGWSVIDNDLNAPVRVTINFNRNDYRMTVTPPIKSFFNSRKRVAAIAKDLEGEVESATRAKAPQALARN